jgi:hypothetical protein
MISSVAGMNIMELKDLIWKKMTETDNGDVE